MNSLREELKMTQNNFAQKDNEFMNASRNAEMLREEIEEL